MSFRHTTHFTVEFGDCDPAQIVFYPNFLRWMDAASRHFFEAAGVPAWRELKATTGILGTPIVDVAVKFLRPASYGDQIAIDTSITQWRGKSFVLSHTVRRGDLVLAEGTEVRVFATAHPHDPQRIVAVLPPEEIRVRCA